MAIRANVRIRRCLQSEVLLVVLGLGLSFLLDPGLFANPSYAPLRFLPAAVWALIFLGVALVGFLALYNGKPHLWQTFCYSAIFLLIWMAIARGLSGQVTATVTYSVLAWSAALRALGISSATFTNLRR